MLNSANKELDNKKDSNKYKYHMHVNENMAIGLFKRVIINNKDDVGRRYVKEIRNDVQASKKH